MDELTQAKYLVRILLTSTLIGSPATITYDWHSDGTNASECEDNFGSVRSDYINATLPYAAKPAYTAALTLQATLGDGVYVDRVPTSAVAAPPGGNASATDVFVLRFAMPDGSAGFAAWTNLTTCSVTNGARRTDCGFFGITNPQCTQRGCCWDGAARPDGPQCYRGLPDGDPPLRASFEASPLVPAQCFQRVVNATGTPLPPACAVGGVLTIDLSDGPTYLLQK